MHIISLSKQESSYWIW